MYELLIRSIPIGQPLSDNDAGMLINAFQFKRYRKGQYLLQNGEIARYETFVLKGMLRISLIDKKGQERVINFCPEGWWAGDLYSFFSGNPTSYNIDCLEPSEVVTITKPELERLLVDFPALNSYFRDLYRNSLIAFNKRVASILCNSASDRYREFLLQYPQIERRVSDRQIASYLGITPQSLSRIRRQYLQQGN